MHKHKNDCKKSNLSTVCIDFYVQLLLKQLFITVMFINCSLHFAMCHTGLFWLYFLNMNKEFNEKSCSVILINRGESLINTSLMPLWCQPLLHWHAQVMSEQEAQRFLSCLGAPPWSYDHVPHKCYEAHSRSVPFSCSAPTCSRFFLGGTSIVLLISQKTSPQPIVHCSACNCRCVVQGLVYQCLKRASWANAGSPIR